MIIVLYLPGPVLFFYVIDTIQLQHFDATFFFFFTIRNGLISLMSFLKLPHQKVTLQDCEKTVAELVCVELNIFTFIFAAL